MKNPWDHIRGLRTTPLLIALNIAMFIWMSSVDSRFAYSLGQNEYLTQWGANVSGLTFTGEPWRLVSSMFIHAGFTHLAFNMLALAEIGAAVERRIGSLRMVLLYMVAGVTGSLASAHWNANDIVVSVGASGAIFGLLGVVVVFGFLGRPGLSTADGSPLSPKLALITGAVMLGLGTVIPLDNAAHVGGFVAGLLLSLMAIGCKRLNLGRTASPIAFYGAALTLICGVALDVHKRQTSPLLERVRMAQLLDIVRSANAETRAYLRSCALEMTNEPSRAVQQFPNCLQLVAHSVDASDDVQDELRIQVVRNVREVWPRCQLRSTLILEHLSKSQDPQQRLVNTLRRYCVARQQLEAHLLPNAQVAPLPQGWRHDLLTYEVLLQLNNSNDTRYPNRRDRSIPKIEFERRTLPIDLLEQADAMSEWQAEITAEDRALAQLDNCPFLSCRRSWARNLPSLGFLLP